MNEHYKDNYYQCCCGIKAYLVLLVEVLKQYRVLISGSTIDRYYRCSRSPTPAGFRRGYTGVPARSDPRISDRIHISGLCWEMVP